MAIVVNGEISKKMSGEEIIETVRKIRRLRMEPHRHVWQAIAKGLLLRLEDAGVTSEDLDRLGL
jgi:hypothetical protein